MESLSATKSLSGWCNDMVWEICRDNVGLSGIDEKIRDYSWSLGKAKVKVDALVIADHSEDCLVFSRGPRS